METNRRKEPVRAGSFRIATIAGIPIRLHFTFLLFIVWTGVIAQDSKSPQLLALIPAIFGCIILHELGHALVARRFGIKTKDITLYLMGGVAFIEGRPTPTQELQIALAGPLVNVVIAAILFPFVLAKHGSIPPFTMELQRASFLEGLFIANLALPLFNMIPALPMDGGRVLRSLLAMNMPESRATKIAASIGQVLAFGMAVAGLMIPSIFLLLIAFLVFMGAAQEVASSVGYSLVLGRKASDAMMTNFVVIGSGETLASAAQKLLEGSQRDFPVVWGDDVLGVLTHDDIVRGLAAAGPEEYVAGQMQREFKKVPPDTPLEQIFEVFSREDKSPVLVMDSDKLVGMLTVENLSEFMTLEQAKSR